MDDRAVSPVAGVRTRHGIWILAAAQAISSVGNGVAALAIPWFVLVTTGSPARMGVVAAVQAGAGVVAGLLGGAAIDRLGYQRTSVLSDVMSATSVLLIPLLHFGGVLEFWHIVLLTAWGAVFDVPGVSARRAMVPALSARAGMPIERANSILELGTSGAAILLGPILAGALMAAIGPARALYVDVATFVIAILLVGLAIPPLARRVASRDAVGSSYWRELADGAAHILHDRVLRTMAPVAIGFNLVLSPMIVVFAVIALEDHDSSSVLALFVAAFGVGVVTGTVVFGAIGHRFGRYQMFVTSTVVIASSITGFALFDLLALRAVALTVGGVASGSVNPMLATLFQTRTPAEMLGRVQAMTAGVSNVLAPLGTLAAGVIIESWSLDAALAIMIAGVWLLAAYSGLAPPMRRAAPAFDEEFDAVEG